MKKINKYINVFFACALSAVVFNACSEDTMDKINENDNNPLDVRAKFMIPELETSTAFSIVGGDLSTYASVYMELETGVFGQTYDAEIRLNEPTNTSTYNNVWENVYSNIKIAKTIIDKCTKAGVDKDENLTLGVAKVLLAYNAAVLTDAYGDAPYSEAGLRDEAGLPVIYQPKVDKQEDIYKDVLKNLDDAITLFNSPAAATSQLGNNDYFYKGNISKWVKATYALKARYTMRLLAKSGNKTTDLNNVISYIDKSFTSAAEEFKYAMYDGAAQNNPLAKFSQARLGLAASASYVNKLKDRNDPRLTQMFFNQKAQIVTDPTKLKLAPNGSPTQSQNAYDITITDYSYAAPTQLMSYHELMFLKAEAYARLGNTTAAETALRDAIGAACANLEKSSTSTVFNTGAAIVDLTDVVLPASVIDTYFATSVKPLFTANPVKEIMNQKYLAFLGASGECLEAYNDYRRLGALGEGAYITLENPKNATSFPKRYIYGNSDTTTNPNVGALVGKDGTYVYTENVWWAGGTR